MKLIPVRAWLSAARTTLLAGALAAAALYALPSSGRPATVPAVTTAARSALAPLAAARGAAAAAAAPVLSANFPGINRSGTLTPPDPNAAASPTQIPVSQACAVTAQEYFESPTNGRWATQLSRFGAPGC